MYTIILAYARIQCVHLREAPKVSAFGASYLLDSGFRRNDALSGVHVLRYGYFIARAHHFILMPADATTFAHFCKSVAIAAPKSSGVPVRGSAPWLDSCLRVSGACR